MAERWEHFLKGIGLRLKASSLGGYFIEGKIVGTLDFNLKAIFFFFLSFFQSQMSHTVSAWIFGRCVKSVRLARHSQSSSVLFKVDFVLSELCHVNRNLAPFTGVLVLMNVDMSCQGISGRSVIWTQTHTLGEKERSLWCCDSSLFVIFARGANPF